MRIYARLDVPGRHQGFAQQGFAEPTSRPLPGNHQNSAMSVATVSNRGIAAVRGAVSCEWPDQAETISELSLT